jgi:aerobic carbon-monoxide dehydrogenase medium subunit
VAVEDGVKPASFQYHAPQTVEEAVRLLGEFAPDDGRIIAGGQSLIPTMALRMARPSHLIDINGIGELEKLSVSDGVLTIGACMRHAAFHRPVVANPLGALLSSVVKHIAHYPIRMRGTFCGSLAHADPSSEWALTAVTLGATMIAESIRGRRELDTDEFFVSIMATNLAEDELLVETRFSMLGSGTRFGFYEFSRRAGDYAVAMALVTFELVDGLIADARVGVGGAEDRPRRLREAENVLTGHPPSARIFEVAAAAAAAAVDPMEDQQADAAYRRDLVAVVTRRALERAAA